MARTKISSGAIDHSSDIADLDVLMYRMGTRLGAGLQITQSAPTHNPRFVMVNWLKLGRTPPGSARVVSRDTLRECLSYIKVFEDIAEEQGLAEADRWLNRKRKEREDAQEAERRRSSSHR
jgi:hypothetical protein